MSTISNLDLYAYVFSSLSHDPAFEMLKERYNDILADLVSAKANANCSCRGRVLNYINKKYQEEENEKTFLDGIFSIPEVKTQAESTIAENKARAANALSGKILTVMKKDNYWQDFFNSVSRNSFRSFSVVDKGDSVDVYFL